MHKVNSVGTINANNGTFITFIAVFLSLHLRRGKLHHMFCNEHVCEIFVHTGCLLECLTNLSACHTTSTFTVKMSANSIIDSLVSTHG